jgi:hypothetical protein
MTTTSTSAEETFKQQQAWNRASGVAAAPWVFACSNVPFVAMPNTSTVPFELALPVLGIEWLNVREPELDRQPAKEQLSLFSVDQDPLQHAVLHLLAYEPQPDEPGDEDVKPTLGYVFPG